MDHRSVKGEEKLKVNKLNKQIHFGGFPISLGKFLYQSLIPTHQEIVRVGGQSLYFISGAISHFLLRTISSALKQFNAEWNIYRPLVPQDLFLIMYENPCVVYLISFFICVCFLISLLSIQSTYLGLIILFDFVTCFVSSVESRWH